MNNKYHIHKRTRDRRRRRILILIILLLLGFGIYWLLHLHIKPQQNIKNGKATVTNFNPNNAPKVHINETLFTVDLPAGWKETGHITHPFNFYMYQGGDGNAQLLSIYIDAIQTNLAVNRVLPVQAQGNQLSHDAVSDNCITFVSPTTYNSSQAQTIKIVDAKYQDVTFHCDVGNFERDVVGTSTLTDVNKVVLTGPTVGPHPVFFAFTDNTKSPDYNVLYDIVDSFRLK